jgi:hypothetical protein
VPSQCTIVRTAGRLVLDLLCANPIWVEIEVSIRTSLSQKKRKSIYIYRGRSWPAS